MYFPEYIAVLQEIHFKIINPALLVQGLAECALSIIILLYNDMIQIGRYPLLAIADLEPDY